MWYSSGEADLPYAEIVGNIEIAKRIHSHTLGRIQPCAGGRSAIAIARKNLSAASHGADDPGWGDLANAGVVRVGDIEVPRCIQSDAFRARCREKPECSRSGERSHRAIGV